VPLANLLSLVAPPLCWSCGAGCRPPEPLCCVCRGRLRWLGTELVDVAGTPTWAPVSYQGAARDLVRALKFRAAVALADAMAAQIVAAAPAGLLDGWVLVPVPLHPYRRRRRGFNQAERLAAAIARRRSLECSCCLERRGPPSAQVGRDRVGRLSITEGSTARIDGATVPARALLVDDVITTGATLGACARALRLGGAASVAAVAYARTPGR